MLIKLECRESGYQYANVRRWGLPRNLHSAGSECDCILDKRFIICPVHVCEIHWTVIGLDLKLHRVFCLDPMDASGVSHYDHKKIYLWTFRLQKWRTGKASSAFDTTAWLCSMVLR